MKLFFSEFPADYSRYSFPYQVWLLREETDEVEKIYDNGFLPIRNLANVYYLSRNVRINLSRFVLSSENRRILKKTINFESDVFPLSSFVYTPTLQKLCKDYAKERFGKGIFTPNDIKNIFSGKVFNYVFVFKEIPQQKEVGYAVCFISGNLLHYAHSFYDLSYFKESLGARMILETVLWAKKSNKKFAYLGTCYEEKALYKTEFSGGEFFNGFRWSENLEELKELLRKGSVTMKERNEKTQANEIHLLKNKAYLERFYQEDLAFILNKYGIRVKF